MKTNNIIAGLMIVATCMACQSKKEEANKESSEEFELSDKVRKELVLAPAVLENISSELQLTGKLAPFEEKQVKVSPLVDGVIEKISVTLGDYVKKGQTMAIIHSSEVADVENQIVGAKSDFLTAQKNLQVQQDLYKSGLASEKDIIIAQNDLLKAEGTLRRANEISGIYGVKNSFYTVKAPIDGYIVDVNRNISEKMAYREGDIGPFFSVADLSTVQVIANVYESDVAKIKDGYKASIRLVAYPDRVFEGKVDKINNVLDPQTRTMQVRINLANPQKLLKPEMFAKVTISYADNQKIVSIPSESIIFDKDRNFVIVYKNSKEVEARRVQVAKVLGNKTFVFNGLKEGERVIIKNQLMIYNALNN
ncbi:MULTISPECIES: efflux RND transporter periplasmic adaptor subunit [unclassified Arcicella]|uniref:efflux RND transporter periplasmic adaptor subunit n=1 Tax=unclassified Arcicella TaxID=2644986 RepID=UPI0028582CE8|nr:MULTISPECIES: efflux RND transporter periplasmic adaptor subunit [unclassified Arcicella]MDR6563993.1 cobalt-zinc-cadmium efflux system membrane fusion protein [Arcicella sp. BE51]MDR6813746.1 cobalt-zinc-cadmium efflux system membrane fusion protein [Arcicella sp. BE140]MDR6825058.1 cobalt-zinc-cadmium efflux system membrane fusion protein [Arcicella sp. BE139]